MVLDDACVKMELPGYKNYASSSFLILTCNGTSSCILQELFLKSIFKRAPGSQQFFFKYSWSFVIVVLTLRKIHVLDLLVSTPGGQIPLALPNLRVQCWEAETTASIHSPLYHANKSQGPFSMMYVYHFF